MPGRTGDDTFTKFPDGRPIEDLPDPDEIDGGGRVPGRPIGQDPGESVDLPSKADAKGIDQDWDDDGILNKAEAQHGTNPFSADSDGDGLSDFTEISQTYTDPTQADSDRDGISDGDEVNRYGTDPHDHDSDGDGIGDWHEIDALGTDPNNADTDGDGLDDYTETYVTGTDPTNSNTDGDYLNDRNDPDPLESMLDDTDGDGLTNWEETRFGGTGTDHHNWDTDGDGVGDGAEVEAGTDPLDAADF